MTTGEHEVPQNHSLRDILLSATLEIDRGEGIDQQEIRRRIRDWRPASLDNE